MNEDELRKNMEEEYLKMRELFDTKYWPMLQSLGWDTAFGEESS